MPNKIPPGDYHFADGYSYVTLEQVKEYHPVFYGKFLLFMEGQTVGVGDNGERHYYSWDYEKWVNRLPVLD